MMIHEVWRNSSILSVAGNDVDQSGWMREQCHDPMGGGNGVPGQLREDRGFEQIGSADDAD